MIRPVTGIQLIAFLFLLASFGTAEAQTTVDRLQPLIETSAQRIALAKEVALAKWDSGANVEDIPRETHVIESAMKAGEAVGLDQQSTASFFHGQIEANKLVQYSLLADWRRSGEAPVHSPINLVMTVRPALDRIQISLISELEATKKLRASPTCRIDLAKAVGTYLSAHRNDASPLLAVALDRAVAGACNP